MTKTEALEQGLKYTGMCCSHLEDDTKFQEAVECIRAKGFKVGIVVSKAYRKA